MAPSDGAEARGQVAVWDGADLRGGTRARVKGTSEGDAFGRAVVIADTKQQHRQHSDQHQADQ